MDNNAASISIIRLSPNPRFLIMSACVLSMVSVVFVPDDSRFTKFPMDVKNAFIIVTLFATNHSASANRISIRRMTSNLISSLISTLSEQNPITKNNTTKEDPTATKIGSIPSITAHGPPPLKSTGDCPSIANTKDIWLFQNPNTISSKERIFSPSLKIAICSSSNIEKIKDNFIKIINFIEEKEHDILFILANIEKRVILHKAALKSISSNDDEKFTSYFLDELILYSIEQRASDIHIEKYQDLCLFKFRVDGRLRIFFSFDEELFRVFSSFVKLISNLDMTQIRLALDGRFSRNINDKKYDFRLSTMPTIEAESIVLRVLDNKNIDKKLNDLGLSQDIYENLKDILKLTQGLILISGPTGSGKTTTLYSILKELNSDDKKIITVEDPIEYKIDSINQVPINNKVGLSFELVLKNILRQDPDIIFIGEIRDKFSLDIALQASLTGHLVLASIHASSSVETITRLIDLKADPFLISTTLKAVMAQRLVLAHCKSCENGCKKCNFTKFYDRTSISEILKVDEQISSLIFNKASFNELKEYLKNINFKTMLDDGKQKVKDGLTTLEEVYKVVNF